MSLLEEFNLITHIHDGEGNGGIGSHSFDGKIEPCFII